MHYKIRKEVLNMSLFSSRRYCPICHRWYEWDVDHGKLWCPRCGPGSILPWWLKALMKEKKEKP